MRDNVVFEMEGLIDCTMGPFGASPLYRFAIVGVETLFMDMG